MADDVQFEFTAQIESLLSALQEAQSSMESAFDGMESKIDEVSNQLDTTLKDAADKAAEGMQSMGEKSAEALNVIQEGFSQLKTLIEAAGIVEVLHLIIEQFREMGERGRSILLTAEAFSITTKEMQGLQAISEEMGLSTDRLRMMMNRLENQMTTTAQRASPQMIAQFKAVGITLDDLQNPAFTVVDALVRMAQSGADNNEIMKFFGRNGVYMLEVVRQLTGGLGELSKAHEIVGGLTKSQLEVMTTYAKQTTVLDEKWQNLKATWFSQIAPQLTPFIQAMGRMFDRMKDAPGIIEDIVRAYAKFAYTLMSVVDTMNIFGGKASQIWQDQKEAYRLMAGMGGATGFIDRSGGGAAGPEERPAPGKGIKQFDTSADKEAAELEKEMRALMLSEEKDFQKQLTADLRSATAERSRLIKEGAAQDLEVVTAELDRQLDAAHAAAKAGEISPQLEYAATISILDQKLAAQKAYYAHLLADATLTTTQIIDLQRKEQKSEDTIRLQMQKARERENEKIKAEWASVTNALKSSLEGAIKGMLAGTESFGQSMRNIFISVFDAIIAKLIDWVVTWVENMIVARLANQTAAVGQISANAGIAATAAMASVAAIPFYGWAMAPEVGAATALEALAYESLASAAGGWEVPRDTLAMVHKDEKILPASFSQGLDDLIKSGGGGDVHAHVHVTAIDTQSGMEFVQKNMRAIASGLSRELSKFNPAVRRSR